MYSGNKLCMLQLFCHRLTGLVLYCLQLNVIIDNLKSVMTGNWHFTTGNIQIINYMLTWRKDVLLQIKFVQYFFI